MVIHDIIPTNARLRWIRLTDMDNYKQCRRQDTKLNLLTQCGVRQEIREWTRPRIALDTKCGPETYTQGIAPSSLFQPVAPTNTPGDLAVLEEYGFLCGESLQDIIGTGMHWLHTSEAVEDIHIWGLKQDATGGELSRGVTSRPGILESSTNGMNSQHTSRHLHTLRRPTKSVLWHHFFKTHLHVNRMDRNVKSGGGSACYITLARGCLFETVNCIHIFVK